MQSDENLDHSRAGGSANHTRVAYGAITAAAARSSEHYARA